MQALIWDGDELSVDDVPPPILPNESDWALVRVKRAGICSTDLHILDGYAGFTGVPGHEMVGVVEKGPGSVLGRRVVAEINFGCGQCPRCAEGLQRHCEDRKVMGIRGAQGAFAELVAVPVANLHVIPEEMSDDVAVFTEPVAAACELLSRDLDDDALVLGDGKLGLLCAQVLGASVRGKHERKLAVARELGLRIETEERQYAVVVEATGSTAGLEAAMRSVAPQGTLVLKTTAPVRHDIDLSPLVVKEIRVIGSRCGPFDMALERLSDGRVTVNPLVDATYALENSVQAFEHAAKPGTLKVLVGHTG